MPPRNSELERLAGSQLFVLDLRSGQAPKAIAEQLGGPDAQTPVRWRDADSELLVFPAETRVRLAKGFVFVELTVATDQTGRDTLVFPFRIGSSPDEAVTSAVSETVPRGNPVIASRWAGVATPLVWFAILRAGKGLLARQRLARPLTVAGVYTLGRVLSFIFTEPVSAGQMRDYFTSLSPDDSPPDLPAITRGHLGTLPLLRTTDR
ncbi:MAG: hypothetical protein ABI681_06715 [Gemmatimonadales bacterium]